MKSPSVLPRTVLTLLLAGCSSFLNAATRGATGVQFNASAQGSGAGVSAQVQTDPRLALAAGLVASGVALATSRSEGGGSADSRSGVGGGVHTLAPDASVQGTGTVAPVVAPSRRGGVAGPGPVAVASGAGSTATTVVPGGAPGSAAGSAQGSAVVYGQVTGVEVRRIGTDNPADVIGGGQVTLLGAPAVPGLVVIDGDVRVWSGSRDGGGAGAGAGAARRARVSAEGRWSVGGGTLLVGAPDGRRWRCRVNAGALSVRTDGANPSGRSVWLPTDGELRLTVTDAGGGDLGLTSGHGVPVLAGDTPGGAPGAGFSLRVRGALDALLRAVPGRGNEALRLAEATQVILRGFDDGQPDFFDVPVTGRSLVLVVDVSYSMGDDDPAAVDLSIAPNVRPHKLDVARAEIVKVLAALPPGVTVNVVAFSSTVQTLWSQPRSIDDAGLAEAIRWVAALHPNDETHPIEAVQAAAAFHPDQMVLLSDGRPSDREEMDHQLLDLVGGMAAHTRFDIVGIGPDQDRAFLDVLADRGRGIVRLR